MTSDIQQILTPVVAIYGRFWRESRWMLFGIAAIVLVAALSVVAAPYVFSRLIDTLGGSFDVATLAWAFVAYAVLLGIATSLQSIVQSLSMIMAQNLNFIAGTNFFARVLKKQVSFFIEHNPAEIQSAQRRGQDALYGFVQLAIIVFAPGTVQFVLTLFFLGATIDLSIVLIVLVYGIGFVTFTYFANKWTWPFLDKAIKASQENAKFVGNSVNAMETLRYFGGDEWIASRFAVKAKESRESWIAFAWKRIKYATLFGTGLAVQFAVTFAALLPRYHAGEISIGDVVLFNTLMLQLNRPFEMIGYAIDDVIRSVSEFRPFATIWSAPEEPDADAANTLKLGAGTLEFVDVSFAYGDKPAVTDISFAAERGRITFLVGETGSGKTTLFKLALKSLEPTSGRILVDGIDLREIRRVDWYSVIGVVPQEIMLLNDTLSANIVLGRPHDAVRLREAADQAAILTFIDGLPEKFETTVGERGLKLSGGERQRVAIARALYARPQVLFLDEASSALDERTEAEIMGELRRLDREVTIIAITHRKTVIAGTDRVVQLPDRVVPQQLAAQ